MFACCSKLTITAHRDLDQNRYITFIPQMVSEFQTIYNPLRESAPMQVFGLEVVTPAMFKDRIQTSVQTAVHRNRYGGPHLNLFLEREGEQAVVVWEWYHGKKARAWKSYRGAESMLLEQRRNAKAAFTLMNGGKSTTVAQPMQVGE